jgi:hypothetical protein
MLVRDWMLNTAIASDQNSEENRLIIGKAVIVRRVYEGQDISPIWNELFGRVSADTGDAAAFLDLSMILQSLGQADKAALAQRAALDISRSYCIRNGDGSGSRILAFVTAGDFMANTPIEFLLEGSDTTLLLQYIDADTKDLADVPDHDVAFLAVGESAANLPVLENLERLLSGWRGAIMNNAPRKIMELTRDGVAETFSDEPSILAPANTRVFRDALEKVAAGQIELAELVAGTEYPIIVRPVGTHAGKAMERIASQADLLGYLKKHQETQYYLAPFIDYSGPDGKFRKQRIAFINGKAFASHLAVSDHWMVHYLSAGMAKYEDRRAEEAAWMSDFDSDFSVRHANAFDVLHRRLGLDYFAIDCAELSDGRLLLFEADVAMIVHALDSGVTFPYKKEAMDKLFAAFQAALHRSRPMGTGVHSVGVRPEIIHPS